MTSTTDTAGHPDVSEISDLTEGLLPPARSADLRRHLDECALCADVHASLEEIRGRLGTLPGPPRMPDDVARRIDAALAAEALLAAAAPGTADEPPVVHNGTAPRRTPSATEDGTHVSRETSRAAVPEERPSGHARGSTGPGRTPRSRRGRRRIVVLGSVCSIAALGIASVVLATLNHGSGPDTTAHGKSTAPADTFAAGTLQGQVTDLLHKAKDGQNGSHAPHSFGVETGPGTGSPRILKSQPTVAVPACVQQGIHRDDSALAAQKGSYSGKDAYLVVLPDTSGGDRVTAYVVDATCVRHPASRATVLLTRSYPRP
ncbi:anti-sigma factor family protein [Streptomyces tropicalis]|uniref:Zinc-finger domain-containing protein n=1 Tax=Streptomyces tropicalis TaxID=3034234 RepID=A0ABT6A8G4_9ACTN|nr:hypothetical protein [Streptomyces tropicalis]MDF3300931.1 hypothetical protein [Streptomyces tropicalis]